MSNGDAIVLNPFGLAVFAYRKENNGDSLHLGNFEISVDEPQWYWTQLEERAISAAELEVILGWMKKDPFKTEPKFSEVTLSNGDRTILLHIWDDGRVVIASDESMKRHWGAKGPSKLTALRWVKLRLYGDVSQEPEFVRRRLEEVRRNGTLSTFGGCSPSQSRAMTTSNHEDASFQDMCS